jgi:uncharacterized membrane protein YhaH (DUF805 family)
MEKPATYWMLLPLKKFATFSGRAPRAEYWWFVLFTVLVTMGLTILDFALFGTETVNEYGIGPLGAIATLAFFLPSLAVTVRRLHDRDKSGWWIFINLIPLIGFIYLFYQYVSRGTAGSNRFGPDPLAEDMAAVFE